MSVSKTFKCDNCETVAKVVVKSEDVTVEDIVYCPICGHTVWEDDDQDD